MSTNLNSLILTIFIILKNKKKLLVKKCLLQSSLLFHLRNMTLILFLKEIFLFKHIIVVKKDDYYYDCEININCVKNSDGSDYCEQYYEADWNKGYQSSDLIISKTSDGLYKIEIKNLNLEAAQPGEFDIEQNKERKTTGSFYFEGRFEDISSLDFD